MSLKHLLLGLAATFALPWLVLIVWPYGSFAALRPVEYSEEAGDELKGFFPPARVAFESRGQHVYFEQGCAQCHTQVIRPQYVGGDGDEFKRGWGAEQGSFSPIRTRQTTPYDYLGEFFAAIGQRRNGPDLSNAAFRFANRGEVLAHLYDPRAQQEWSTCPSQRHLFSAAKIQGQPSLGAVPISGKHAPAAGCEIVPSDKALALADYILALKRNYPLPISLGGEKPVASPAPAAPAAPAGTAPAGANPGGAAPASAPGTVPPATPAPAVPPASAPVK